MASRKTGSVATATEPTIVASGSDTLKFAAAPQTFTAMAHFQFMVGGKPTRDLDVLRLLWRDVTQLNQGDDGRSGLRYWLRIITPILHQRFNEPTLKGDPELRQLFAAYMRTALQLGAQQGRELIWKAFGASSHTSAINYVNALKKKQTELQQTEIDGGRPTSEKARIAGLIVNDCDDTLRCLMEFSSRSWYPLASAIELYKAQGSHNTWALVSQALEHRSSVDEIRLQRADDSGVKRQEIDAWAAQSQDNAAYYKLRETFRDIEVARGVWLNKLRRRSQRYLEWLRSRPEFAQWRNSTVPAAINPLDDAGRRAVERARGPRKKIETELREFFRVNPEIAALDQRHGDFDRRFAVRRRHGEQYRLMPDDFVDPVGYSEPDAVKHPRHVRKTGPQSNPYGWKDLFLKLPKTKKRKPGRTSGGNKRSKLGSDLGSITIRVFDGTVALAGSSGELVDVPIRFHRDKRFRYFHSPKAGEPKKPSGLSCLYWDRKLQKNLRATFAGVRLRFRDHRFEQGELVAASVFLDFTVDIEKPKQGLLAERTSWTKASTAKAKNGVKRRKKAPVTTVASVEDLPRLKIPEQTIVASIIPNAGKLAWVSVFRVVEGRPTHLRTRNIAVRNGIGESDLRSLREELDALLSLSGDIKGAGQRFAIGPQDHHTNSSHQRIREGAASIANFVLGLHQERVKPNDDSLRRGDTGYAVQSKQRLVKRRPAASLVLIGSPSTLKVNPGLRGGENRQRAGFASMSLAETAEQILKVRGRKVVIPERSGYQLICGHCGCRGWRYTLRTKKEGGKEVRFNLSGELFACTNADCRNDRGNRNLKNSAWMNSAWMLVRCCMEPALLLPYKELQALPDAERQAGEEQEQTELRPLLSEVHGLPMH